MNFKYYKSQKDSRAVNKKVKLFLLPSQKITSFPIISFLFLSGVDTLRRYK